MDGKIILRDDIKTYLLTQIKLGHHKIGKTINLAALARKLNVSVTPIREALTQLEESDIVKAIPNRGFIINELSLTEAIDLYNTVAQLEVIALDSSTFSSELKYKLKNLQLRLQQTHMPKARLTTRLEFHETLVEACDNVILKSILKKLKTRILFYEQLYFDDATFYETIDNQNEGVLRAIEEDNLPTAALILKMNWMTVLDYLKNKWGNS
ncbi:GntR family transcriptional regulator [Croceitalea sp. MTPC9]|uniref:GntR family transcriptional regulator n=1 Tax=unclassified Croceitalea TaxID=2632280 RepID=UPI002B363E53|nr:GntR family transcriptional regulator [Croceitalea sp. MTPC6]GMN15721.1 GntR family transcriptional regulator [Croceitalea sp. MTPC9]